MEIKEIIEKGINGGWDIKKYDPLYRFDKDNNRLPMECIFLDPKFWEAVGKVEGWGNYDKEQEKERDYTDIMHQMIDHLNENENNTIESFIKTL